MGCCRQYNALMWKNTLIKGRHWKSTCFEILLPVLIMLLMVLFRSLVKRDDFGTRWYPCDGCMEPTGISDIVRLQLGFFGTFGGNVGTFGGGNVPTSGNLAWNESHSKLFIPYQVPFDITSFSMAVVMAPGTDRDDFVAAVRRHAIYTNVTNPDSSYFVPLGVYTYDTTSEFESYYTSKTYAVDGNPKIFGAWYINQGSKQNPHWDYTIRLPVAGPFQSAKTLETKNSEVNTIQVLHDSQWLLLYQSGFFWMQHIAENYFLSATSGLKMVRTFSAAPFATPPYINDNFASAIGSFLGIFFTIVYLWPVTRCVKLFVDEKESRIKEGMRMMGLSFPPWFLSHLMTSFTLTMCTSILITIVTSGSVFKYSNKVYVWFFFFIFGMSVFSFGFFMSVFFSRSRVATTFSAIIFFAFFFPYFGVSSGSISTSAKMVAGLSPPISFGLGAVCIFQFEATGSGIQRNNVGTLSDNISYNDVIGMLLVDFFGYLILGLYLDRIIKTEWGTPLPWYFPVLPSFWCPPKPTDIKEHLTTNDKAEHNDMIEPVSEEVRANVGVSIQKLRKEFVVPGTGDDVEPQVAVRDISLDLYTNQILALLGHNGAGKTTTINMLSGMMPPTAGDAYVFGNKISTDMAQIRQNLGVCPQHNILFADLSVQEHLELYCAIKGVPRNEVKSTVKEMISQVGLEEKVKDKSSALSGGMQRKLSVAIALIGDSKIVFLDEPTSGMDPYSRRATWDLLKKKKEGRVIILTTHFMDEADQLGDRIAIMAAGSVKCCGSSLFLKSRYGVGYTMTVTKSDHCDAAAVDALVHKYVHDAEPLSNVAGEMSYRLPLSASTHFADMFEQMDKEMNVIGIDAYGISVTTLEEVFLRVGHEAEAQAHRKSSPASSHITFHEHDDHMIEMKQTTTPHDDEKTHTPKSDNDITYVKGKDEGGNGAPLPHVDTDFDHNRFTRIFRALMIKRWNNAKRDRRVWTWTILYPFLILLLGVGIITSTNNQNQSARTLSTFTFNSPNRVPFQTMNSESTQVLLGLNASNTINAYPNRIDKTQFTYDPISTKDNQVMSQWLLQQLCAGYATDMQTEYNTTVIPNACTNLDYKFQDSIFFAFPYNKMGQTGNASSIKLTNTNVSLLNNIDNLSDVTKKLLELTMQIEQQSSDYTNNIATWRPHPVPLTQTNYNTSNPSPDTYFDAFTLMFNTTVLHGVVSAYNLLNTGLLRTLSGDNTATITVTTWPLPLTADQQAVSQTIIAVIAAIAFAFIPASFIGYAVKEETDKSKHQQLISGVSAPMYWSANYIWDFTNYLIPGLLCLMVFGIFNVKELIGENAGATFLSILLYGVSIIPFTYILSFLFDNANAAQNVILLLYIFVGALLLIASIVLDIISSTKDVNSHLKYVYRLFPSYDFGEVIVNLIARGSSNIFDHPRGIWDFDVVGWPMLYMGIESVVYVIILYIIEFIRAHPGLLAIFQRRVPVEPAPWEDDIDVVRERERVKAMSQAPPPNQKDESLLNNSYDTITLSGLRKVYPSAGKGVPKVAVHDLWLGIPEGECFGYLGINGAGKTTTLKMLTADIIPTAGTGYLGGYNMLTEQANVRKLIGYCPQFDALIDTLTAREHLFLFARIKGIPEEAIPDYVEKLIIRLGLQEGIADKPCRGYSGGNKRKLCVGIALIGSPKIVFLDEPSTGMDPGSRRFMWDLIASTMKGRSVILTTHSMEEVTALCSRIGIMVGGRLRCLGSTQHLKSRYGDGYQMDVHLASSGAIAPFQTWMNETFPGSKLIEAHSDHLKYEIPKNINGVIQNMSNMFRIVEREKHNLQIAEYSLSETTLEQIFINFAKQQDEEKGQVAGIL